MLLAPAVEGARWLLSSLWWGHLFAPQPTLLELLVTITLYPAASWLLGRIHNQIPRLIHAS